MQSKTISRVMSCVIIYPMELSPVPLSDPPENMTGSHIRFLFGLASDGVYMAFSVTRETVVSYTAFPPLPGKTWRYLSVALSLESPPPDVIRHPALRSPDFPRLNPFVCSAAITWPGCASDILAQVRKLVKFVFLHCHVGGWLRRSHFNAVSAREGDLRVPKPERNAI